MASEYVGSASACTFGVEFCRPGSRNYANPAGISFRQGAQITIWREPARIARLFFDAYASCADRFAGPYSSFAGKFYGAAGMRRVKGNDAVCWKQLGV